MKWKKVPLENPVRESQNQVGEIIQSSKQTDEDVEIIRVKADQLEMNIVDLNNPGLEGRRGQNVVIEGKTQAHRE